MHRHRRLTASLRRAGLAALLLVAAAGCGDDEEGADDTTTTEIEATSTTKAKSTTTTTEVPDEVDPGAVEVEVLDVGAEPRVQLRLDVAPGSEHAAISRQRQDVAIDIGGQVQESASATEQELTYAVDAVEGGRIHTTVRYGPGRVLDDPPVDDATREVLDQVLGAFEGTTGSSTFDLRGGLVALRPPELDGGPPGMEPFLDTMVESLESQATQLAMPFPEEAVGVGARWRISAAFEMSGLPFEITTEVELTVLDGTRVEGRVTQVLDIVRGPVELQGLSAEVVEGTMTGGGSVFWRLDRPMPLTSQELAGTVVMVVTDPSGDEIEVTQTLRQVTEVAER